MRLDVGDAYEPAWEPLADATVKKMAKNNQKACYQGDDFGGNNIPFPHPTPPKPDAYYDDAFLNLSTLSFFADELNFADVRLSEDKIRVAKVEEKKPEPVVKVETPEFAKKVVAAPKPAVKVEEKAVEKDDDLKQSDLSGSSQIGYGPYDSYGYDDGYYNDGYYNDGYANDGYYNDGYANDGYYGDSYGYANDGYGYANDDFTGDYDSFNDDKW